MGLRRLLGIGVVVSAIAVTPAALAVAPAGAVDSTAPDTVIDAGSEAPQFFLAPRFIPGVPGAPGNGGTILYDAGFDTGVLQTDLGTPGAFHDVAFDADGFATVGWFRIQDALHAPQGQQQLLVTWDPALVPDPTASPNAGDVQLRVVATNAGGTTISDPFTASISAHAYDGGAIEQDSGSGSLARHLFARTEQYLPGAATTESQWTVSFDGGATWAPDPALPHFAYFLGGTRWVDDVTFVMEPRFAGALFRLETPGLPPRGPIKLLPQFTDYTFPDSVPADGHTDLHVAVDDPGAQVRWQWSDGGAWQDLPVADDGTPVDFAQLSAARVPGGTAGDLRLTWDPARLTPPGHQLVVVRPVASNTGDFSCAPGGGGTCGSQIQLFVHLAQTGFGPITQGGPATVGGTATLSSASTFYSDVAGVGPGQWLVSYPGSDARVADPAVVGTGSQTGLTTWTDSTTFTVTEQLRRSRFWLVRGDDVQGPFTLQVPISVTAQPQDVHTTYGGADAVFTVAATGQDAISWELDAGFGGGWQPFGTVTGPTLTVSGVRATNGQPFRYRAVLTNENGTTTYSDPATLTVDRAVLTVTPPSGVTMVYGDPVPTLTPTVTGWVGFEADSEAARQLAAHPTCAIASLRPDAGAHPITCGGGIDLFGDYDFAYGTDTLTVTKAPLTLAADPASRTYGAANPALTGHYVGLRNGDPASAVNGTPACSTPATPASPVTAAGYPITCSTAGLTSASYEVTGSIPAKLTVTKAPLTVAADAKSRPYRSANPALTAHLVGLVNGDAPAAAATGAASCTTTAGLTSDVGTYPITCALGTLASQNYAFTAFAPSTLSVVKAASSFVGFAKKGFLVTTWSARLVGADGSALGGRSVTISVGGFDLCTTTTAADGTASCTALSITLGKVAVSARWNGDGSYLSATGSVTL